MKKLLAGVVCVLSLGLTGCATYSDDYRLQTGVKFSEYNNIANRFMEQPTYLEAYTKTDSGVATRFMMYRIDMYGTRSEYLTISENKIDQMVEGVDKYLKWEKVAVEKGDLLQDVEVASINREGYNDFEMKLFMWSANQSKHVMVVRLCSGAGGCFKDGAILDKPNAEKFRQDLLDFKTGKQKQIDMSSYK